MVEIPLVSVEEVQVGRGKTKGEKYGKYAQAIAPNVRWLLDRIRESPDGKIRVKVKDIAKVMGTDFEKKSDTAIYWGLKFVLFHEGIVVDTGTAKDKGKLLVMRQAAPDDKLPPSLAKVLEPPEEEMPEPGSEE
jgi:hypothetical protein